MTSASQINTTTSTYRAQDLGMGKIQQLSASAFYKFRRIIRNYVLFNTAFCLLAFVEFLFLLFGFSFLSKSSVLAISLAIVFLTAFSYFILRLYFQTKHPEQFRELCHEYLEACKKLIGYREKVAEDRLSLANAACQFASLLHNSEYTFYTFFSSPSMITPIIEKLSCWWHWQEVLRMRELLLFSCIAEHIKLVKDEPTHLQVHASLANAYILLSTLYRDPRELKEDSERWIPPGKLTLDRQQKFRAALERAIEELKILQEYAPGDPWVHIQLAYSYHDLQLSTEEIGEYETVLQLCPDDRETLFKLGALYFEQGLNAKGLRIYEQLKQSDPSLASAILEYYGSFIPPELSEDY